MAASENREDLHNRLTGKRYYDSTLDESFTIVGVNPPLALLQYDDGHPWDEACTPENFTSGEAYMLGISEGGIDSEQYIPLDGGGPTLSGACAGESHDFFPRPSEMGLTNQENWRSSLNTYHAIARCKRCGLSAHTLSEFLGHPVPEVCECCEDDAIPGDTGVVFEPTPDHPGVVFCEDCAETARDEYDTYDVYCHNCWDNIGTNEENQPIPASSPLGSTVADEHDKIVYLCTGCRDDCSNKI